jgi:hypothetical protein
MSALMQEVFGYVTHTICEEEYNGQTIPALNYLNGVYKWVSI